MSDVMKRIAMSVSNDKRDALAAALRSNFDPSTAREGRANSDFTEWRYRAEDILKSLSRKGYMLAKKQKKAKP